MNTQIPDDQRLEALQLALMARKQPLSAQDRTFLEDCLARDGSLAPEIEKMELFLSELVEGADLGARQEFRVSLRDRVKEWVREDVSRRPVHETPVSSLGGFFSWLFARENRASAGVSPSTLLLGRSLAVYLGVATAMCLFFLMRDPGGPSAVVDPGDQAQQTAPSSGR